jgi:F-type H+-transporting ATPase subunit epsilon
MLNLSIVTPSKKLITDVHVDEVFVHAYVGELNILEGHAPLMSTLETGVLKYRVHGETKLQEVAVSWGYLEVSNDRVSVLAETAEAATEIDLSRAQDAKANAEKLLLSADLEQHEFLKQQLKLERAVIRIEVAGHNTTH